ncbi:MAG TPA: DNA topoisomerase IB, partial [Candidatus Thermoplasmatota archaeon]|nr:DNA topoisomerase IB [Candidatus Thermoplasmatota archaeon]
RVRAGRGFRYVGADGRPVDARTRARIEALAIPPAWRDVWICPSPRGHVQATGRDARGRKQYRYHARWRARRDGEKYVRMAAFGEALPALRARVARDLARPGLPREKTLAAIVRVLDAAHLRVGNDEYARRNGSYGLATLRNGQAEVRGSRVRFRFPGKGGKEIDVDVADARVARVVRACRRAPGRDLFCYRDESGRVRDVRAADVNAYLREATGRDFTAKDFRTWAGTLHAVAALREAGPFDRRRDGARRVAEAMRRVAERLGNTPAVCRKSYVHPAVLASYLDGSLEARLAAGGKVPAKRGLRAEERALLRLLARQGSQLL